MVEFATETSASQAMDATVTVATFDSRRIEVATRGSGPDVVLIPGLTSSPGIWADAVDAVPGFRYHLVQVKGFAGTAPMANATGPVVASVAEEIARYIAAQKLRAPAIVGHSMGGTIAMIIASRHPTLADRVMVVDMLPFIGVLFAGPTATVDGVKSIAAQMRAESRDATPEQRRARQVAFIDMTVKTRSARARPTADSLASDPETVANAYHELMLTDLRPALHAITAPMTVLYQHSASALYSDAQMDDLYTRMYANAPAAKLVRVPGAWHFIMLDAPVRFQAELNGFLAR